MRSGGRRAWERVEVKTGSGNGGGGGGDVAAMIDGWMDGERWKVRMCTYVCMWKAKNLIYIR